MGRQQQLVGARRIPLYGFRRLHRAPEPAFHARRRFYSGTRQLDQNQVQVGFNYKFGDAAPEPASAPLIVKGPAVTADLRSPPPAFQPVSAQALPPKALVKPVVPSAIDWTGYNWTGA